MDINGKRVVDATKPVTISITARDVANGDNKNPSGCAAARAAKHSIEDCISARVHIGRVYIEQEKKWVRYNTPDSLKQEIIAFDRGGSFAPGEYVLRPVSSGETPEGRRSRREDKNRELRAKSKQHPRKVVVKIAKIRRHEVSGIRPKGANR
jgi:hypothetical protein